MGKRINVSKLLNKEWKGTGEFLKEWQLMFR